MLRRESGRDKERKGCTVREKKSDSGGSDEEGMDKKGMAREGGPRESGQGREG